MEELKIAPYLPEIIHAISESVITVVAAPTGTGKSLAMADAIARSGARVFACEPTVIGTLTLSNRLKFLSPDLDVGYAAESVAKYNDRSQVVYATSGHIRRKMMSYFRRTPEGVEISPIDFCDVLIIDEAHTGILDNTVIIDLWKYAWKHAGQNADENGFTMPRLVLSSATLDLDVEGGGILSLFPPPIFPTPAVIQPEIKHYDIEVTYDTQDYEPDDPELYVNAAKRVAEFHTSDKSGDVLVFAPGKGEVEAIVEHLNTAKLKNVIIIPAYAALSTEEIKKIHVPTPRNMRKIVVATNIAEAVLTIENIAFIVDTMCERRAEMSLSGGFRLTLTKISQSSANQRKGRTGRTRPGVCHRMITLEGFNQLEPQRPPEILRVPIYTVIMELLKAGLRPVDVLSEIDHVRVGQAVKLLTRLGLVDPVTEEPTEGGDFVVNFSLSVRNAAALWKWAKLGKPMFPAIAVLSMIDCYGPSYMYYPRKQTDDPKEYKQIIEEHRKKYFEQYRGRSDIDTLVNIWNDFIDGVGGPSAHSIDVLDWCRDHSLNHKKMKEVLQIVNKSVADCHSIDPSTLTLPSSGPYIEPFVQPEYTGRAFSDYLHAPGGLSNVTRLIVKSLQKVRVTPEDISTTVRTILDQNADEDDETILTQISAIADNLQPKTYDVEKRAEERTNTILKILDNADYKVPDNAYVLDIGCGDCSIVKNLCSALKTKNCYGTDVFKQDKPVSGVKYTQVEGDNYPYEDNTFDIITAFVSLHHIKNLKNIDSLKRILKPGGILIIREHNCENPQTATYLDIVHGVDEVLIEGKQPEDFAMSYYAKFFSRAKLEVMFSDFTQVHVQDEYAGKPNPQKLYYTAFLKPNEEVRTIEDLLNAPAKSSLNCREVRFTREGVMALLRPILSDVYADMTMALDERTAHSGRPVYIHGGVREAFGTPHKAETYQLDTRNTLNTLLQNPPPYILAILTAEIAGKQRTIRTVSLALDLPERPVGFPEPMRRTRQAIQQVISSGTGMSEEQRKRLQEARALASLKKVES